MAKGDWIELQKGFRARCMTVAEAREVIATELPDSEYALRSPMVDSEEELERSDLLPKLSDKLQDDYPLIQLSLEDGQPGVSLLSSDYYIKRFPAKNVALSTMVNNSEHQRRDVFLYGTRDTLRMLTMHYITEPHHTKTLNEQLGTQQCGTEIQRG